MSQAGTKMSADGVVEIPEEIRSATGIHPGDELIVEARGSEIVLRKAVDLLNYKPPRARRDLGLTDREIIDIAREDHITEKFGNRAPKPE